MHFIKFIYYGLLVTTLAALLINHKKLEKKNLLFIPILLLAILTQVAADVLKAKGHPHYFLFHLYIPAEYALLSIYYYHVFTSRAIRLAVILSNLVLLLFSFFYYFSGANFFNPDYTDFLVIALMITLWVIFFFLRLFRSEEQVDLLRYPDFWINTGNLFFYAGCLFVMGLHYSLRQQDQALADGLLVINNYLNLVLYVFYAIAFTWLRTNRTY